MSQKIIRLICALCCPGQKQLSNVDTVVRRVNNKQKHLKHESKEPDAQQGCRTSFKYDIPAAYQHSSGMCGVLMSECSHCYFHVRGTHHANGDNVNKLNREYVSYGGHKKRNVRDICCLCMSAWVQLGQRNHELTVKSD